MTTAKKPKFSRILLKLSGESLGDANGVGISPEAVQHMAGQIREVRELGVQVVVVVGGGNIFRGLSGSERGIERATGDYMGMLATVINALALQDALEKLGCPTRVQSAIAITLRSRKETKYQDARTQLAVKASDRMRVVKMPSEGTQ